MSYDPDMDLYYSDDASSFDVEVTIIDPESGENRSLVTDNLTNAMYFIVQNNLHPIREGYTKRIDNIDERPLDPLPDDLKEFVEAQTGMSESAYHELWRQKVLHDIMITITCEGNPDLVDTFFPT